MWIRANTRPTTTLKWCIIRNSHHLLSTQPGDLGKPASLSIDFENLRHEIPEVDEKSKNLLALRQLVSQAVCGSEEGLTKSMVEEVDILPRKAEKRIVNNLSQPQKYNHFLELYNSSQETDCEYDPIVALFKSEPLQSQMQLNSSLSSKIEARCLLKTLVKNALNNSSTAPIALLSTLSKLLVAGETMLVRETLLSLLNHNSKSISTTHIKKLWRIYYAGESQKTVIDLLMTNTSQSQGEIAVMLVRLSLAWEYPLLAASLLSRVASIKTSEKSLSVTSTLPKERLNSLVSEVIETITIASVGYRILTLQVLSKLRRQFPRVPWTRDQTSRLLELALEIDMYSNVGVPSQSNHLLTSLTADYGIVALEPVRVCDVIRANLRVNNDYTAYKQWKLLSSNRSNGAIDIPISFLSYLIRKWSNNRRYRHEALRIITEFVPIEKYGCSGIAEAILHYCALTKTDDMAVLVIEKLAQPMTRSNLAALLELQLELDQPEGVKRVVGEIFRQTSHLAESEVTMLAQVALRQSTAQGVALVQRFESGSDLTNSAPKLSRRHYIMAYCAILDKSYERMEWDNVTIYTAEIEGFIHENKEKISGSYQDRLRLIQLKHAGRSLDSSSEATILPSSRAQKDLYQQWQLTPNLLPTPHKRLVALRIIGLQAINENDRHVFEWVLKMMEAVGVSKSALKAEWFGILRERQNAGNSSDELIESLQY